ncbi:MAG TPA: YfhH family protein [Sporosarcina psychrophila]|uniref:YfhH family protein n=1 Tax=Sporosarcina psychrophila TaxID=1476 RepID=A0A921G5H0_SPOPS|nr:YfhH family protein [Sporosarcina psychrophila]
MENEKKYSAMTEHELRTEIGRLREKARKAEQLGIVNEYAVYQRKVVMAQSYLIDPKTIEPGEIYKIEGDEGMFFQVDYLKGRFAWGYRLGGERADEALPIAMLKSVKEGR